MIETTVRNLISVKSILQQLANVEMPARESFKVLRILKALDKEYESIEATQIKLLESYAKKDEDGQYMTDGKGGFVIAEEHANVFADEMNQLLDTQLNLECNKLGMAVLDSLNLSPAQLLKMEDFLEIE
jgi:hypothetical protein